MAGEMMQEFKALNLKLANLEKLLLEQHEQYLTVSMVSRQYGISKAQVYNLVNRKTLKSYKFGGKLYLSKSEIDTAIVASAAA